MKAISSIFFLFTCSVSLDMIILRKWICSLTLWTNVTQPIKCIWLFNRRIYHIVLKSSSFRLYATYCLQARIAVRWGARPQMTNKWDITGVMGVLKSGSDVLSWWMICVCVCIHFSHLKCGKCSSTDGGMIHLSMTLKVLNINNAQRLAMHHHNGVRLKESYSDTHSKALRTDV